MNDDMLELRMWRDGNIMHENCLEDMEKLKKERDEVRREVCQLKSINFENKITPKAYAELRKWDCFKEKNDV